MYKKLKYHWSIQELVTIGVFAAAAKVITMVVALAGGGMNPVTLLIKNLIFTTFFIVMLYKVRKSGTIMLCIINSITAFNGGRGFHLFRNVYGVIYW